jgi:hypothetical protein
LSFNFQSSNNERLFAVMKKLIILLSLFVVFGTSTIKAQDLSDSYDFAIGVKMYPGAITLKKSIDGYKYLEGIAAFWNKGFRATGLYEVHADLLDVEGLKWYYGAGAHVGFYNDKYYSGSTLIGIDGVLGLDYKIKGAPLNLSADWQPSFEFGNGSGFEGWGGLSIRFAF